MSKQLTIQACKCTLILYENELFNGLRPELLAQALKRGKGYKRSLSCEQRQHHVDSFQLLQWLQGKTIPNDVSSLVEIMPISELRKGCVEYLNELLQKNNQRNPLPCSYSSQ